MNRTPELDGLRGLAVIAVVGFHLADKVVFFGWAAVDLFFVLSGYLITSSILRDGDSRGYLARFYARRCLRIWPIYYLTLLVLVALSWAGQVRGLSTAQLWSYMTYTPDCPSIWGASVKPWEPMAHAWTLAIEEQFYMIWPVAILLFRIRSIAWPLGLLAMSVALRWSGSAPWSLDSRLDGLALGSMLAILLDPRRVGNRAPRQVLGPWILASAGIGGPLFVLGAIRQYRWGLFPGGHLFATPWAEILAVNLLAFALVALILANEGHPRLSVLRWPPLVFLGLISYGVYLYHHPIRVCWLENRPLEVIAATLAISVISWYAIERPILGLKRHLRYGKPGQPVDEVLPAGLLASGGIAP